MGGGGVEVGGKLICLEREEASFPPPSLDRTLLKECLYDTPVTHLPHCMELYLKKECICMTHPLHIHSLTEWMTDTLHPTCINVLNVILFILHGNPQVMKHIMLCWLMRIIASRDKT